MDIDDLLSYIVCHSDITVDELEDWTTEELEELAYNLGMRFD